MGFLRAASSPAGLRPVTGHGAGLPRPPCMSRIPRDAKEEEHDHHHHHHPHHHRRYRHGFPVVGRATELHLLPTVESHAMATRDAASVVEATAVLSRYMMLSSEMASAVRLCLASMIPVPGPFREGRVARAGFGFAAHRSLDRIGGAGGGTRTPTGDARRIFLPATAFAAAPKGAFGVWTIPSPCSAGAEGRCCPSSLYTFPLPGLARDCHVTGFPEFEQFYIAGFPART